MLSHSIEIPCRNPHSIVHVVVRVLLAYGVHGWAKFAAIVRFGGCFDVGQQRECELWDTNDDTIHSHSCRIWLHQLHVDTDLLAKVKVVVDNLEQLLQHVVHGWSTAPSMADFITSNKVESLMLLWLLPLAVRRMASVTSLLTNLVMASATPSLAPMTNWLMTFSWSASSYASALDVIEGRMILPVDAESLSAKFFPFLIM